MTPHDHQHGHGHDHPHPHPREHDHRDHAQAPGAAAGIAPSGAHSHVFLGSDHARNERRTWIVIGLTSAMMVAEIVAGSLFGSMALLADGFHMSTHAGALLIAALAYLYARRHASDERFTFGTGKIGDLAAFSSAIILAVVAIGIGYESVVRLSAPVPIRFGEAISVAVIGLVVNLASAVLLHQGDHSHGGHEHGHGHDHHDRHTDAHRAPDGHMHRDQNLRAAYLHVLADALTSVLAIAGLLAGWLYGWIWMDAAVGILGAVVIARWSFGLLKDSGAVLLDIMPSGATARAIRRAIESDVDRVSDLHLWRVGPGHMAAVISVVSERPQRSEAYKERLASIAGLSHISVEVLNAG